MAKSSVLICITSAEIFFIDIRKWFYSATNSESAAPPKSLQLQLQFPHLVKNCPLGFLVGCGAWRWSSKEKLGLTPATSDILCGSLLF